MPWGGNYSHSYLTGIAAAQLKPGILFFLLLSWIWPCRSRLIYLKINRDLNQGVLHLYSEFGNLVWTGDEFSRGHGLGWHTDKHGHTHGHTHGRLREKHKCIVMRRDEDYSAYSESVKRVECTNWEYRRVRVTHQLSVPQTHWFAVSVW